MVNRRCMMKLQELVLHASHQGNGADTARRFRKCHDYATHFRVSAIPFYVKGILLEIEVSPVQAQAFARRKLAINTVLEYNIK